MLVDYDIAFQQLNSFTLIGNAKVGESWILGFDADHRRSPLLELSNALIGQTAQDLPTLQTQLHFTPSQIRQLALDRTSTSNTVVLSASRSIGERWQFMAGLSALELSGTPAFAGVGTPLIDAVTATRSTGLDKNASVQMSGSSLLQASDLHIFSVRFDASPISRSTTLYWDARFVVHGAWRLGPRLSVEQLNDATQGGKQMLYLPQVRGDWTNRRSVFEITAGYQLQNQQALQQPATLAGQPATASVGSALLVCVGGVPGALLAIMKIQLSLIMAMVALASCSTRTPVPSHEIFDEHTASTLLVAASPLVFARERSDVAAHARDYVTLVAVEIDTSGDYRQYLILYRWSTVDRRMLPPPDPAAGELRIIADGRVIEMRPLEKLPLSLEGRRELLVPNHGDVVPRAYKVDVGTLNFIAASHDLVVRLPQEPLDTPLKLWEDGRGALAQFLKRAEAPCASAPPLPRGADATRIATGRRVDALERYH
jgi:hypothetical protein